MKEKVAQPIYFIQLVTGKLQTEIKITHKQLFAVFQYVLCLLLCLFQTTTAWYLMQKKPQMMTTQFLVQSQKYQTLMDVPKYGDALFLHYQIMRSVHLNLSVSAIAFLNDVSRPIGRYFFLNAIGKIILVYLTK